MCVNKRGNPLVRGVQTGKMDNLMTSTRDGWKRLSLKVEIQIERPPSQCEKIKGNGEKIKGNKLASLGATLVRNYDSLTYLLTGVKCRATSVAKNTIDEWNVMMECKSKG